MMRIRRQLTPEELRAGLAMLAGAADWYRLELDQEAIGQCVRWPLAPARTVVWIRPLGGRVSVPQVKVSPLLEGGAAGWQDVPVAWRPGLLRAVLLLERNKVRGATVQRRLASAAGGLGGRDGAEHRWDYTVQLHGVGGLGD